MCPNKACCVFVPLGKHLSPLPCKHVCIPSMFPSYSHYGDPSTCAICHLCLTIIMTCTSFSLCWFKPLVKQDFAKSYSTCLIVLEMLWLTRRLRRRTLEARRHCEICLKQSLAPGSHCWSNNGSCSSALLSARHWSPVNKRTNRRRFKALVLIQTFTDEVCPIPWGFCFTWFSSCAMPCIFY